MLYSYKKSWTRREIRSHSMINLNKEAYTAYPKIIPSKVLEFYHET